MKDWLEKYNKFVTVGLVLFIALGGIVLLWEQKNDKTLATQNSFKAEKENWQREKDEMGQQMSQLQKQITDLQSQKAAAAPSQTQSSGTVAGVATTSPAVSGIVNINTADAAALDSLPGIGPAKAQAIIDYRTTHGNFKKTTDLKNVKGIGDSTFEKLKDKVSI